MHTRTTAAALTTGDYALVGGVFRRVTAAELHSKNGLVMVCYASHGWEYLEPQAEVVIAA